MGLFLQIDSRRSQHISPPGGFHLDFCLPPSSQQIEIIDQERVVEKNS